MTILAATCVWPPSVLWHFNCLCREYESHLRSYIFKNIFFFFLGSWGELSGWAAQGSLGWGRAYESTEGLKWTLCSAHTYCRLPTPFRSEFMSFFLCLLSLLKVLIIKHHEFAITSPSMEYYQCVLSPCMLLLSSLCYSWETIKILIWRYAILFFFY